MEAARVKDWQAAFWNVVKSVRETPFEWGKHDCATFAIECVAAVRGEEFKKEVRVVFGEWATAMEAARATAAGLQLCGAVILGKPVRPALLSMGDLGIFRDDDGRETFCVHDGANFICPGTIGLQRVPFERVLLGWRI